MGAAAAEESGLSAGRWWSVVVGGDPVAGAVAGAVAVLVVDSISEVSAVRTNRKPTTSSSP